jgi:tRNA G18 (ribose-2'-O)-methylase SpoU
MIIPIDHFDDPRLDRYRNLPERSLRGEKMLIAEGQLVAERLWASDYEVESFLVIESLADYYSELTAGQVPVYKVSAELIKKVAGFNFHRGVLAAGRRTVDHEFETLFSRHETRPTLRLAVCPEIKLQENIGLLFRSCAGFEIDAVLLGPGSGDPLSRRAIRLSMGATLRMPYFESSDLRADLNKLRDRLGVSIVATVLDESAEKLPQFDWPDRSAILFGNEFAGLDEDMLAVCDRRVTIPMPAGVDSLNLAVAAGIFLYEMTKTTPHH